MKTGKTDLLWLGLLTLGVAIVARLNTAGRDSPLPDGSLRPPQRVERPTHTWDKSGALQVDGISLGMTEAAVEAVLGKPTYAPQTVGADILCQYRNVKVCFAGGRAFSIDGDRLQQGQADLVEAGDENADMIATLGRPDCVNWGEYLWMADGCMVSIPQSDGVTRVMIRHPQDVTKASPAIP